MTRRADLVVFTGNVAGHAAVPELVPVMHRYRPDVVVLTEAKRVGKYVRRAFPRYQLVQYRPEHGESDDTADVALLVARDLLPLLRRWAMRLRLPWVGPFAGIRHGARVYPIVRLQVVGQVVRFAGVHFPPSGPAGRNADAWRESAARLVRWLTAADDATVAAGDWNGLQAEVDTWVTGKADAHLAVGGKVDHLAYRRCHHLATHRLDQPDGMHGWMIYRLDVTP